MPRNFDEDSGRSTCSAGSVGLPAMDYLSDEPELAPRRETKASTDLKVSIRPRSVVLIKSPDEKDPFPSCRAPRNHRKPVFNLFDTSRRGGLSDAHSTLDIACSTRIEEPSLQGNAISMNAITLNDRAKSQGQLHANFRRGKPVQRAASRLYKAAGAKGREGCVGPEFIVRASQPPKQLDLTLSANAEKRIVTVILLNGQKFDVTCDPNIITAGQLFEALVHSEKYEHNFMLGIAILIGGDFVFLPDDYKIRKVAPDTWYKAGGKKKAVEENVSVTVFLRIKFFLPKNISTNIQDGEWRHRVYLQLRRATVEGQLTSTVQNLVLLAGYALHIEFGEFSYREHGTADYFLLEHYLPECVISGDMADVKLRMKRAHESRHGLDRNKAIVNYITLAQTFRDYGAHFYSAVWATRDGFCRDVWLSIGPRGVTIYSRCNRTDASSSPNRIVLQSLPWHHIHTFHYNKKSLYIVPNSYSGLSKIGVKYKLKMTDNKSYFTFWLASLHHRLYLKLYAKSDFINYLSDDLNCPPTDSPRRSACSNYQDSYNLAVRNQERARRPARRRFRVDIFGERSAQNKENEKPNTEEMLRQILSPGCEDASSSRDSRLASCDGPSSSESSLPRRRGVKMGTRVFSSPPHPYTTSSEHASRHFKSDYDVTASAHSDSDEPGGDRRHCSVDSMRLLPERQYRPATAYVLESPKVYPDALKYDVGDESCLNTSLFERLDECVQGERVFVTAALRRDADNALGLQVAEGSDGKVYIKSITAGGPAHTSGKLRPGDQIISVNGQTLLNVKYERALAMLQTAPAEVELIVLQNADTSHSPAGARDTRRALTSSIASALDREFTDDELLNEEALKTIYALIRLTKEKVINKMRSNETTPNKSNLQKCASERNVFESYDTSRTAGKFGTWRYRGATKRRPLSLSIPTDLELPDDYLDDEVLHKSSLKSIKASLDGDDKSIKSGSAKNVALPRNYGLSRKWVGPVRYPVTPCKNNSNIVSDCAISDTNVLRRHFVYAAGDSDEEQIFL